MRNAAFVFLLFCCLGTAQAVTCDVVRVDDADEILIGYRDLRFSLALANIDCSRDDGFQEQRVAVLNEMLVGHEPELLQRENFGFTDDGRSRIHLRVDRMLAAETLLAQGLAAFAEGTSPSPYDRQLKQAEATAKEAKLGRWAADAAPASDQPSEATDEPVVSVRAKPVGGGRRSSVAKERPPFAGELNSNYYYPSDAQELTDVNPQRLIFYPTEDDARKAGKRPAPTRQVSGANGRRDIESARAAFSRGERLYAEAIAAGNTGKRDDLYGQAFAELTTAVQIFSELLEQDQDNEDLGEELRRAMQLRYGAMKQRRA